MASTLAASYASAPAHEIWDLVVVGGGPAGLAVAIVAAEQGLSVVVVERRDFPPDKACGEGVLPPGVKALQRLGIANRFDRSTSYPFAGIRFIQEDGSAASAHMPSQRDRHQAHRAGRGAGPARRGTRSGVAQSMFSASASKRHRAERWCIRARAR